MEATYCYHVQSFSKYYSRTLKLSLRLMFSFPYCDQIMIVNGWNWWHNNIITQNFFLLLSELRSTGQPPPKALPPQLHRSVRSLRHQVRRPDQAQPLTEPPQEIGPAEFRTRWRRRPARRLLRRPARRTSPSAPAFVRRLVTEGQLLGLRVQQQCLLQGHAHFRGRRALDYR